MNHNETEPFDLCVARNNERIVSTSTDQMLKRFLDLSVAVVGLAVFLPLLVFVGLLVMVFMGRPVLFRQRRPGLHGMPFLLCKFRTMNSRRGSDGALLPDRERITRIGLFLRVTSLDELPQLWNVLRGQMSLVGPRPLLMEYLDRYTPEQARRHEALPGITGWTQVNGRNALDWDQKLALDVWYVDHRTLGLDFKILLMTAMKVLRREGISRAGHATMPEFLGSGMDAAPRK